MSTHFYGEGWHYSNTMILVFGICCFIAALIPICVLPLISGMIF